MRLFGVVKPLCLPAVSSCAGRRASAQGTCAERTQGLCHTRVRTRARAHTHTLTYTHTHTHTHVRSCTRACRSILKQYLDGISINDDVMNNPINPLLVVNNRLQVSWFVSYSAGGVLLAACFG